MIPAPIKLKPRLRRLFNIIQTHGRNYDCVWDCCCDHGYLGMKLLRKNVVARVEFVDCVPHLMEDLRLRLGSFTPETYGVTCADAGTIELATHQRHLVILAGIGGELAAAIIDNIISRHPHQSLSFLLCPNTAQFHLREYLISRHFNLIEEDFLREKRWNYEILHVDYGGDSPKKPISAIGQHWQSTDKDHLAYLAKMQKHYSDQSKNCTSGKAAIIAAAYQAGVLRLNNTSPAHNH